MAGTHVVIPYAPRTHFLPFHESTKRWSVIVAHRRSGKTTACINHLQRDALTVPNSRYAYIAPTYKQAKNIAWDIIKFYAKPVPGAEFNESELTVRYPNGSRITLYGADNPDSLRGIGLWGVVFDEYSQQPSNIFSEIIRPALADHSGYAVWIGTPKGKNDFWKLYEVARTGFNEKGEDVSKDWFPLLLTVDDTKVIPDAELADARTTMSEDEYLQEFMCSFEAAIKGAYYASQLSKARADGRISKVPYDELLPVSTWWDLGIGDSTAILFFQNYGKEWRLIDSYEQSGEGLAHYAKVLTEKGYFYKDHWGPHDIEVKELGTGRSRKEIAASLGIKFKVAPKLSIEDGINAVRMRFSTLWIDEEKNSEFLHCISLYRKEWDDKRGEFKNAPFHDFTSHYADALRYWAVTRDAQPEDTPQYRPAWLDQGGYPQAPRADIWH